jgi:uncharacterized damage-inducible protein DinB
MYYFINDFLTDWAHESESTGKLLRTLTDASLEQKVTEEGRSLGRLAWHITGSVAEMMNRTGFAIAGPTEEEPVPVAAGDIADTYEKTTSSLAAQIKSQWNDQSLQIESEMYGEKWKNGLTLSILIAHQAHHRGQMTVLMRQAGLPVPGVYGPSKEEWAQFGMTAQP